MIVNHELIIFKDTFMGSSHNSLSQTTIFN